MTTTTLAHPVARTLSVTAVGLLGALALPFVVHAIPYGGTVPLGAQLLPIFFVGVVLIARGQPLSALLVAAASPWLNQQLTGMPAGPMLSTLTVELLLFTLLLLALRRAWPLALPYAAPVAYLAASVAARWLLTGDAASWARLGTTLEHAWPGLLLLLVIGIVATPRRTRQRAA
jgi:hypothetical protein